MGKGRFLTTFTTFIVVWLGHKMEELRIRVALADAAGGSPAGSANDTRIIFWVDCVWNVMAHAQKPNFVFRRNGWVHLNRRGLQFSRLQAAEVCASTIVMLDTPCSEVVWRVLVTHSIRQFPFHYPSRASHCAITFQLDSTTPKGDRPPTAIRWHYISVAAIPCNNHSEYFTPAGNICQI